MEVIRAVLSGKTNNRKEEEQEKTDEWTCEEGDRKRRGIWKTAESRKGKWGGKGKKEGGTDEERERGKKRYKEGKIREMNRI